MIDKHGFDFESKYTNSGTIGSFLVDRFYRSLFDLMRLAPATSVYECACGAGHSTQRIRAYLDTQTPAPDLRASDVDDALVERARSRVPGIPISTQDIYHVASAGGHPDLVIALEVLEHLEFPGDALTEIMALTQRWAIVSVPREPLWRLLNMARGAYVRGLGNTPGHLQHWTQGRFLEFVRPTADPIALRAPIPWTMVLLERR